VLQPTLRVSLALTVFAGISVAARAESALDRYPAAGSPSRAPAPERRSVSVPLAFEANDGQTDPRVKFLARSSGYTLFLTSSDAVLAHGPDAVRMKFRGANARAHLSPLDRLPGVANYLLGQDPAGWRTNVATYAKIRYEELYPGIDLVFYGNDRQLEYDLIVHPGADTRKIRLALDGARELKTAGDGGLVARTRDGEIRLHKPMIYQASTDGQPRRAIDGRFRLIGAHTIAFDVGAYDRRRPLVIDPVVVYSTYLGGGAGEQLKSGRQMIAVDANGSAYVTGTTDSSDFPTTGSALQPQHIVSFGGPENRLPCIPAVAPNYVGSYAFVAKLSPDGSSLVYGTYLGGTYQIQLVSGIERCGGPTSGGTGIAVDSWGNAYVTGFTDTVDFPGTFGHPSWTMFVTKLDASGSSLMYSTRLESSVNGTASNAIAVGTDGSAYVTGTTYTSTLATPGAFQTECKSCNGSEFGGGPSGDAFVLKLDPAGTGVVYATLIGGSSVEVGNGIAVDPAGQAYVTGTTTSIDLPTSGGAFPVAGDDVGIRGGGDVFVTKLSADGSRLIFSTYLNSDLADVPGSIAADAAGNSYVTGWTRSADFPTTEGAFQRTLPPSAYGTTPAFVTKFTPGGELAYSTFLAGVGLNQGVGIAVDGAGRAYVVGATDSLTFPTVDATQPSLAVPYPGGGSTDAFVSVLNASGSALVFSTYLGGPAFDYAQGVALGPDGSAYVVGVTSHDDDPFFPTTVDAFQRQYAKGGQDLFVSRIAVGAPPDTTPPAISVPSDITTNATAPAGAVVTYTATASDLVDGALTAVCTPVSGSTFAVGTTTVSCSATDSGGNTGDDTFSVTVLGAGEITSSLIDMAVASFQQGSALLRNVFKSLSGGNTGAACNQLGAFLHKVEAQSGKALTVAEAAALTHSAQDARAALGCP
jgi:HYR domain-containing protein/beta-propeller repeat-containing protein